MAVSSCWPKGAPYRSRPDGSRSAWYATSSLTNTGSFKIRISEWINAQPIPDELFDYWLSDAVLLGYDLLRLPTLANGFQPLTLKAVIDPVGAIESHEGFF